MKIDSELIVQLRHERSWSQEELAISSGLNLRTIQRIEKEGVISLQSKKALAATFNIDLADLDFKEPVISHQFEYKTVVLKSDVNWISGWGKKNKADGPFELDETLNQYAKAGWKVHTFCHGSSVHGGAGQVIVHLERTISIPDEQE